MLTGTQKAVKRKQDKVNQINLLCRFFTDTGMTLLTKHCEFTPNAQLLSSWRMVPPTGRIAPAPEKLGAIESARLEEIYSGKLLP